MDRELVLAFLKKYGPEELSDDELELVTGGNNEASIKLMQAYCKTIPVNQVRDECEFVLKDLIDSAK